MNLKMDNRMKTMKYILAALLSAMALVSCNDWLTLGPIDYYGSESYWKLLRQRVVLEDGGQLRLLYRRHAQEHA